MVQEELFGRLPVVIAPSSHPEVFWVVIVSDEIAHSFDFSVDIWVWVHRACEQLDLWGRAALSFWGRNFWGPHEETEKFFSWVLSLEDGLKEEVQRGFLGCKEFAFLDAGFAEDPPVVDQVFGLVGEQELNWWFSVEEDETEAFFASGLLIPIDQNVDNSAELREIVLEGLLVCDKGEACDENFAAEFFIFVPFLSFFWA